MRSFSVAHSSPHSFVERVRSILAEKGLDDIVSVQLAGGTLVVRFSRLGTSELRFAVKESDDGFAAEFLGLRVAPLHAPFRGAFEARFEEVLDGVGARLLET